MRNRSVGLLSVVEYGVLSRVGAEYRILSRVRVDYRVHPHLCIAFPPSKKKPAQERATSRSKHRRGSQEGRPKRRPERKKRGRPRERRLPAGALPCLCRNRPHWLDSSPEPEPEKTETYIFFLFCIFQEFNFSRLFQ